MGRRLVESVMGGVVLAIAAFFLIFAYTSSNLRPVEGYPVQAKFNSVGGLEAGSDVRISGVKVGSVVGQYLDSQDYRAVVTLSVANDVKLPADTLATIESDGLLGGKFIALEPGRAEETIPPGGALSRVRDSADLEQILGRAIFLLTEEPGS